MSSRMADKKEPEAVLINPKVKEFTEENPDTSCNFCGRTEVNKLMFGPLYHLEDVTVHYFCMLFSAGLSQYGEDSEGILGFMPKDIKKELHRGRKLKCKYCKRANATVGCSNRKCKVSFHYPCGLEKESNFQFLNNYESYCNVHKRDVAIPIDPSRWECPICYVMVGTEENPLFSPCCQKGVFHRTCIMAMAQAHGVHFFKCPLCNDKDEFSEYMRFNGVYVPERDAVWEMEPNAFSDLNEMHNRCDAVRCQCPKGREYSSTSKEEREWRIVRCGGCGAEAVHKKCGNLDLLTYRCDVCASVLAGAPVEEIDSDDEEEEMVSHRRRQVPGHTPGRRIIRRGFDGSDDELELPPSRIREITSNGQFDLESDDSNASSSASSCSFTEVTGIFRKKPPNVVPFYGKKFQILGHDNDDDNTDSDDSEDDEFGLHDEVNYFTTDSSVTVHFGNSQGTKSQLAESEIGGKDNLSCTKVDSSNIRDNRTANFYKRYKKFGVKLDKLKMLSEQIVKTSDQEHGDSHDKRVDQGRAAGLGASCSYSPEDKLTELLKQSLNQVSSTSAMRQLRSTAKLPDGVKKQLFSNEEQASASTSEAIDKVTNFFSSTILGQSPVKTVGNKNARLTRSRSKEGSSSSGMEESPVKKNFAHDPLIQKIVSTFTASALTIIPLTPENPSSLKSENDKSEESAVNKRRAERPVIIGPQAFKIPKKPATEADTISDPPSSSTRNSTKSLNSPRKDVSVGVSPLKQPFIENDVIAESNCGPEQNFLMTAEPPTPVTLSLHDPDVPAPLSPHIEETDQSNTCSLNWDLPENTLKPTAKDEREDTTTTSTSSSQKRKRESSESSDSDIMIVEADSDDDVVFEAHLPSVNDKIKQYAIPESKIESDDDEIQMEVVRLAPTVAESNEATLKSEPPPTPLATAFLEISKSSSVEEQSSVSSAQSTRYFSGNSLTGMSAALIAMSSSSNNKKVIPDSKADRTDSESHEIVITLSDDEEETRIESSSSSRCKVETTELPKPPPSAKNNPQKPKTSGEVNSSDCSTQPNPPAPSSDTTSSVNLRSKRGRDIDSSSRNDDIGTDKKLETSFGSETKRPKRT